MEFLIRAHTKTIDPAREDELTPYSVLQRGDVIYAAPDGHSWSQRELTNPAWRIVRVNLTETEATYLLSREIDLNYPTEGPPKPLWARRAKVDLDNPKVPAEMAAWLLDDQRTVPILDVALPKRIRDIVVDKGAASPS